ncbi:MAG: hypothetical protein AAF828_11230 [Bacteroidota bacterium]
MNRLLHFILTLIFGALALRYALPWWTIAIIALLIGVLVKVRRRAGFWYAFLAGMFVWGGYVTYVHLTNNGILAGRMANLFQLGNGWFMVIITGIWGGITAGLGGWTGVNLRKAIIDPSPGPSALDAPDTQRR